MLLPDSSRTWERIFEVLDTHIRQNERKRGEKSIAGQQNFVPPSVRYWRKKLIVQEVGGVNKRETHKSRSGLLLISVGMDMASRLHLL
jgi:hypothetical protein